MLLLVAVAVLGALLVWIVHSPEGVRPGPTSTASTPSPVGASPSPIETPTPVSNTSASATSTVTEEEEEEEAATALFPASGTACGDATGDYAVCPVSSRMEQRLTALNALSGLPYRPMCRCSRSWDSVSFHASGAGTVEVTFTFSGTPVTMVLSLIAGPGGTGWVADDTTCAGADLYSETDPPPCWAPG
jgi:hypothetical protein